MDVPNVSRKEYQLVSAENLNGVCDQVLTIL
jgi:hypothetical protein